MRHAAVQQRKAAADDRITAYTAEATLTTGPATKANRMLNRPNTASTVFTSTRTGSTWPAGSSKYIVLTMAR